MPKGWTLLAAGEPDQYRAQAWQRATRQIAELRPCSPRIAPRNRPGAAPRYPTPTNPGAKSFTFEVTSTAVNSGRQNVPVLRIVPHGAVVEPVELLEAQRQGLLLNA